MALSPRRERHPHRPDRMRTGYRLHRAAFSTGLLSYLHERFRRGVDGGDTLFRQCCARPKDKSDVVHLCCEALPESPQLLTGALTPQSLRGLPTFRVEVLAWKVDEQPWEA